MPLENVIKCVCEPVLAHLCQCMLLLCWSPPVEVSVVANQVGGHLTDITGCHIEIDRGCFNWQQHLNNNNNNNNNMNGWWDTLFEPLELKLKSTLQSHLDAWFQIHCGRVQRQIYKNVVTVQILMDQSVNIKPAQRLTQRTTTWYLVWWVTCSGTEITDVELDLEL